MSDGRPRVAVLADKRCEHDGRVIKGAESLAALGYEVMVFAQSSADHEGITRVNGVTYRRIPRRRVREEPAPAQESLFHESQPQSFRVRLANTINDTSALFKFARLLWRINRSGMKRLPLEQRLASVAAIVEQDASERTPPKRDRKRTKRVSSKTDPSKAPRYVSVLDRYSAAVRAFRPSLIHGHELACLAAAAELSAVIGCPFIYDARELADERQDRMEEVKHSSAAELEAANIRKANAVITTSEQLATHLTGQYGIHPLVMYDTPRSISPDPAHSTVREDLALGKDTPLAVYTGLTVQNRGIERFLRAMQSVPALHFALVGIAQKRMLTLLQSMARDLGIAGRVHLLPPVPFDALPSFISSASFGVIPALAESETQVVAAPNKLFEMIFAGLPILMADVPQRRSILEKFGEGVLFPNDPRADLLPFIEQMIAQGRNESWRSSCREKALAAWRTIGWEQQMPVVDRLYTELLATAPSSYS